MKINEELKSLIPPLTQEKYSNLEKSIKKRWMQRLDNCVG